MFNTLWNESLREMLLTVVDATRAVMLERPEGVITGITEEAPFWSIVY